MGGRICQARNWVKVDFSSQIDGAGRLDYKGWLTFFGPTAAFEQASSPNHQEHTVGGIIERQKELRRRRKRTKKLKVLKRKLEKATPSEKAAMAGKIRNMTPGAEVIIANWGLEERK